MNKQEVWKDVVGYEGEYLVSNYGRVKSLKYGKNRLLALIVRDEYHVVCLHKNRKQATPYVHQIEAKAFLPNPEGKLHINHIDGNKTNNYIDNIEWATPKENIDHAVRTGLIDFVGEKHPHAKTTWKIVNEIRNKFKPRKYTIPMLCKEYGMNYYTMRNILYNVTWSVQV